MTQQPPQLYIPITPGEPPLMPNEGGSQTPPPVMIWYRIFCGAMAAVYLLVLLFGLFMILAPAMMSEVFKLSDPDQMANTVGNMVMGVIYSVMGFLFFVVYVIGAFLPPRNWCWVAGLVLICLSFTSCCCLPVAIPLMIYWIKPETKLWFRCT